eukprot:gene92-92_t
MALIDIYPEGARLPNKSGNIPLLHALGLQADIDVIRVLLNAYPESSTVHNLDFDLAIHVAIKSKCSLEVVKLIATENENCLKERNSEGDLPLHVACGNGSPPDVICFLLSKYPDAVRVKNYVGDLPLHLAAGASSCPKVIKVLLKRYQEASSTLNSAGVLPLQIAISSNSDADVIALLLAAYPKAAGDRDGLDQMAVHLCVIHNCSVDAFKAVLYYCPLAIQETDNRMDLPIHKAAKGCCSIALLRAVIGAYPDGLKRANDKGDLPLHVAASSKSITPEILRIILSAYPPAASIGNKSEYVPLFHCLKRRARADVVSVLLAANPSVVKELCMGNEVPDVYRYLESVYVLLSLAARVLRVNKKYAYIGRFHVIGPTLSGKSALFGRVVSSLSHSGFTRLRRSLSGERLTVSTTPRHVMNMAFVRARGKKWTVVDFPGESVDSFARSVPFLTVPNTVFIVVIPLWDLRANKQTTFEEAIAHYRYWLRVVESIAQKGSKCVAVCNFRKLAYKSNVQLCKRIKAGLIELQRIWKSPVYDSKLEFLDTVKSVDVNSSGSLHLSFGGLFNHPSTINSTHLSMYAIMTGLRELSHVWPKIMRKSEFFDIHFMPLARGLVTVTPKIVEEEKEEEFSFEYCLREVWMGVLDRVLSRLQAFGELFLCEGGKDSWILFDASWVSSTVIPGVLSRSCDNCKDDAPVAGAIEAGFIVSYYDILHRCRDSRSTEAELASVPALLCDMGYCFPVYRATGPDCSQDDWTLTEDMQPSESTRRQVAVEDGVHPRKDFYCFPSLCSNALPDVTLSALVHFETSPWRSEHLMLFSLRSPLRQGFPPGYFPALYCFVANTASTYCPGKVEVYSNCLRIQSRSTLLVVTVEDGAKDTFAIALYCQGSYSHCETLLRSIQVGIEYNKDHLHNWSALELTQKYSCREKEIEDVKSNESIFHSPGECLALREVESGEITRDDESIRPTVSRDQEQGGQTQRRISLSLANTSVLPQKQKHRNSFLLDEDILRSKSSDIILVSERFSFHSSRGNSALDGDDYEIVITKTSTSSTLTGIRGEASEQESTQAAPLPLPRPSHVRHRSASISHARFELDELQSRVNDLSFFNLKPISARPLKPPSGRKRHGSLSMGASPLHLSPLEMAAAEYNLSDKMYGYADAVAGDFMSFPASPSLEHSPGREEDSQEDKCEDFSAILTDENMAYFVEEARRGGRLQRDLGASLAELYAQAYRIRASFQSLLIQLCSPDEDGAVVDKIELSATDDLYFEFLDVYPGSTQDCVDGAVVQDGLAQKESPVSVTEHEQRTILDVVSDTGLVNNEEVRIQSAGDGDSSHYQDEQNETVGGVNSDAESHYCLDGIVLVMNLSQLTVFLSRLRQAQDTDRIRVQGIACQEVTQAGRLHLVVPFYFTDDSSRHVGRYHVMSLRTYERYAYGRSLREKFVEVDETLQRRLKRASSSVPVVAFEPGS